MFLNEDTNLDSKITPLTTHSLSKFGTFEDIVSCHHNSSRLVCGILHSSSQLPYQVKAMHGFHAFSWHLCSTYNDKDPVERKALCLYFKERICDLSSISNPSVSILYYTTLILFILPCRFLRSGRSRRQAQNRHLLSKRDLTFTHSYYILQHLWLHIL